MESRQKDQDSKLNVTENDSERTEIKPIAASKIKKRPENGPAKKVQFYSLPPISDDKRKKKQQHIF